MRLTAGESVASRTSRDVLGRGLRVLGRAIREQPRIFAVAVAGSVLFGLMVIASAFVVGAVVGEVVVPAIARGSRRRRRARAGRRRRCSGSACCGWSASSAAGSAPATCSSGCRPPTAAG